MCALGNFPPCVQNGTLVLLSQLPNCLVPAIQVCLFLFCRKVTQLFFSFFPAPVYIQPSLLLYHFASEQFLLLPLLELSLSFQRFLGRCRWREWQAICCGRFDPSILCFTCFQQACWLGQARRCFPVTGHATCTQLACRFTTGSGPFIGLFDHLDADNAGTAYRLNVGHDRTALLLASVLLFRPRSCFLSGALSRFRLRH
mmetsp:Transcript_491/g.1696  ORF Transcript_491/g.1696 Transcript_491/m.1696 type:complete len:200 (+) Transcript_491:1240-1839(+)